MKKNILFFILLLSTTITFGQAIVPQGNPNTLYDYKSFVRLNNGFILPKWGNSTWNGVQPNLAIDSTTNLLKYHNGTSWVNVNSGANVTLQQVTDNGNTTTNSITAKYLDLTNSDTLNTQADYLIKSRRNINYIGDGSYKPFRFIQDSSTIFGNNVAMVSVDLLPQLTGNWSHYTGLQVMPYLNNGAKVSNEIEGLFFKVWSQNPNVWNQEDFNMVAAVNVEPIAINSKTFGGVSRTNIAKDFFGLRINGWRQWDGIGATNSWSLWSNGHKERMFHYGDAGFGDTSRDGYKMTIKGNTFFDGNLVNNAYSGTGSRVLTVNDTGRITPTPYGIYQAAGVNSRMNKTLTLEEPSGQMQAKHLNATGLHTYSGVGAYVIRHAKTGNAKLDFDIRMYQGNPARIVNYKVGFIFQTSNNNTWGNAYISSNNGYVSSMIRIGHTNDSIYVVIGDIGTNWQTVSTFEVDVTTSWLTALNDGWGKGWASALYTDLSSITLTTITPKIVANTDDIAGNWQQITKNDSFSTQRLTIGTGNKTLTNFANGYLSLIGNRPNSSRSSLHISDSLNTGSINFGNLGDTVFYTEINGTNTKSYLSGLTLSGGGKATFDTTSAMDFKALGSGTSKITSGNAFRWIHGNSGSADEVMALSHKDSLRVTTLKNTGSKLLTSDANGQIHLANNYNPDWAETDPSSPSYIKNKPNLGVLKLYYVNSNNPNAGDGSIINPFKTIDAARAAVIGSGTAANPQNQYTTINVAAGTYTTSNNLFLPNTNWHFESGAVVTYTGSNYLFEVNANYTYFNVTGRMDGSSTTGGLLANYQTVPPSHLGVYLELNSFVRNTGNNSAAPIDHAAVVCYASSGAGWYRTRATIVVHGEIQSIYGDGIAVAGYSDLFISGANSGSTITAGSTDPTVANAGQAAISYGRYVVTPTDQLYSQSVIVKNLKLRTDGTQYVWYSGVIGSALFDNIDFWRTKQSGTWPFHAFNFSNMSFREYNDDSNYFVIKNCNIGSNAIVPDGVFGTNVLWSGSSTAYVELANNIFQVGNIWSNVKANHRSNKGASNVINGFQTFVGIKSYANQAAAVADGVPSGGVYYNTTNSTIAIVP